MSKIERKRITHKTIKQLAKELKVSSNSLIALSTGNDPFFMGGSPAQRRNAIWMTDFWTNHLGGKPMHPRGINYKLLSAGVIRPDNGKLYLGDKTDWKFARSALTAARYMGLIPYEAIIDNKTRFDKHFYLLSGEDINELVNFTVDYDWIRNKITEHFTPIWRAYEYQDTICEVWIEKSSVIDDVNQVINKYSANQLVGYTGDISLFHCYKFVIRAIEAYKQLGIKRFRIFYISDFDPVGRNMPISMSRKVEYLLNELYEEYELEPDTLDIRLESIAVTPLQREKFSLRATNVPREKLEKTAKGMNNPYKTRVDKFYAIYNIKGVIEIEALTQEAPTELADVLEDRLSRYYDLSIDEFIEEQQNKVYGIIDEMLESVDWETFTTGGQLEVDWSRLVEFVESVEVPKAEHTDEEDKDIFWLLDTNLGYVEQLKRYTLFRFNKEKEFLEEQGVR